MAKIWGSTPPVPLLVLEGDLPWCVGRSGSLLPGTPGTPASRLCPKVVSSPAPLGLPLVPARENGKWRSAERRIALGRRAVCCIEDISTGNSVCKASCNFHTARPSVPQETQARPTGERVPRARLLPLRCWMLMLPQWALWAVRAAETRVLQLFQVSRPPPESLPRFPPPRYCKERPAEEEAADFGKKEHEHPGHLVGREQAAASGEEEMHLGPACCSSCRESTPQGTALSGTLWPRSGRSVR